MSFSRILAIDFSAASVPTRGENSIWTGLGELDGPIRTSNLATRSELSRLIERQATREGRTLVVIDVALGWPSGMAKALGVSGRSGLVGLLSELLMDDERNRNNRFEVANELNRRSHAALFWGHPATQRYAHLAMTKKVPSALDPRPFSAMRIIEHHVGGVIKSPVQLCGVGAVGSQSLMAQFLFERLRERGVDISIWPFEPPTSKVVVAEYFFSLLEWRHEAGAVKDQRQVRAAVKWARRQLRESEPLSGEVLFHKLSSHEQHVVQSEEGWLMGWPSRLSPTR